MRNVSETSRFADQLATVAVLAPRPRSRFGRARRSSARTAARSPASTQPMYTSRITSTPETPAGRPRSGKANPSRTSMVPIPGEAEVEQPLAADHVDQPDRRQHAHEQHRSDDHLRHAAPPSPPRSRRSRRSSARRTTPCWARRAAAARPGRARRTGPRACPVESNSRHPTPPRSPRDPRGAAGVSSLPWPPGLTRPITSSASSQRSCIASPRGV